MLLVGLYEWKIITAHPILTVMFKNILRTSEAEILKIFKNIQSQSIKLDVLTKKECISTEMILQSRKVITVKVAVTRFP